MAEQPVNLSPFLYLGVFSRAEQRVLQAIFKAIAEGNGRYVATLARLARELEHQQVNHAQCDRPSGRNWPSEKDRTRSQCAVSLPNILTYGEALGSARDLMRLRKEHRLTSRTEDLAPLTRRYAAVWEPKAPPGGTGLGGLTP